LEIELVQKFKKKLSFHQFLKKVVFDNPNISFTWCSIHKITDGSSVHQPKAQKLHGMATTEVENNRWIGEEVVKVKTGTNGYNLD
jgi:hypothetical protein